MTLFLINIAHEQAKSKQLFSQVPRIKCVSTANTLPGSLPMQFPVSTGMATSILGKLCIV